MTVVTNFVEAKNILNNAMNELIPLIEDYFANNEINYTNSGQLYKKNQDAITSILKPFKDIPCLRVCVKRSYNSTIIEADINYQVSEFSCAYIKDSHFIGTTHEKRKNLTVKQVQNAKEQINKLGDKIRELENKKRSYEYLIEGLEH